MSMFDDYDEQQAKPAKQARLSKQQQQQQPGSRLKPSNVHRSGSGSSSDSEDEKVEGKSHGIQCGLTGNSWPVLLLLPPPLLGTCLLLSGSVFRTQLYEF